MALPAGARLLRRLSATEALYSVPGQPQPVIIPDSIAKAKVGGVETPSFYPTIKPDPNVVPQPVVRLPGTVYGTPVAPGGGQQMTWLPVAQINDLTGNLINQGVSPAPAQNLATRIVTQYAQPIPVAAQPAVAEKVVQEIAKQTTAPPEEEKKSWWPVALAGALLLFKMGGD